MDPGSDIEAHHHAHGRGRLDTVLAFTAVGISVVSAVLAIQHGNAMEKMVETSSWPYLQIRDSNGDEQGRPLYKIILSNQGVGPAKIRRLSIAYEGRPTATVFALAKAVGASQHIPGPYGVSTSDAAVIPARGTDQLLTVSPPVSSAALIDAFRSRREAILVTACYCSIFDECWTTSNQGSTANPVKVRDCGGAAA